MIILDTNVISELLKPQPDMRVQTWILDMHEVEISTTVVTISEIEYGLQRLPVGQRKNNLYKKFGDFIYPLHIFPFDELSARETGRFRATREKLGLSCNASDMMIAGIASKAGVDVATRNIKGFDQLPIKLINPWVLF